MYSQSVRWEVFCHEDPIHRCWDLAARWRPPCVPERFTDYIFPVLSQHSRFAEKDWGLFVSLFWMTAVVYHILSKLLCLTSTTMANTSWEGQKTEWIDEWWICQESVLKPPSRSRSSRNSNSDPGIVPGSRKLPNTNSITMDRIVDDFLLYSAILVLFSGAKQSMFHCRGFIDSERDGTQKHLLSMIWTPVQRSKDEWKITLQIER